MPGSRTYRSVVRAEHARQTRRRVVQAAHDLFEERGYAGTTIDAVAERAGVSRRTVFISVGAKSELLKTAWDWAVVGDDVPVPMVERPAVAAMKADRDVRGVVSAWAAQVVEVAGRVSGLAYALTRAADVDPEAATLQARIDGERRTGARHFVSDLQSRGVLRAGLEVDPAVDMVEILMSPLVVRKLRDQRGWSTDQIQEWVARMTEASLLA